VDDARREYSLRRLAELTNRLARLADMVADRRMCVYATGSYGRLEAGTDSDIDLFFLCVDDEFPSTLFLRVAAAIVEATEEMGFPPFTGDGEYLEVHYVQRMEEVLGSARTTPSTPSLRGCCFCLRAGRCWHPRSTSSCCNAS
jgi:hypothetical protein